jgi:hypothetical protein
VRAGLCRQQGGPGRNRGAQRPHPRTLRCPGSMRGLPAYGAPRSEGASADYAENNSKRLSNMLSS